MRRTLHLKLLARYRESINGNRTSGTWHLDMPVDLGTLRGSHRYTMDINTAGTKDRSRSGW